MKGHMGILTTSPATRRIQFSGGSFSSQSGSLPALKYKKKQKHFRSSYYRYLSEISACTAVPVTQPGSVSKGRFFCCYTSYLCISSETVGTIVLRLLVIVIFIDPVSASVTLSSTPWWIVSLCLRWARRPGAVSVVSVPGLPLQDSLQSLHSPCCARHQLLWEPLESCNIIYYLSGNHRDDIV